MILKQVLFFVFFGFFFSYFLMDIWASSRNIWMTSLLYVTPVIYTVPEWEEI